MTTRSLILMAVLLCFVHKGMAQASAQGPSSVVLQSCLLGTNKNVWATLGLTGDQLRRMERVQEACKEECDVAGAQKDPNSISNADGSMIMIEVKNILSSDQYRDWVAYCTGSAPK